MFSGRSAWDISHIPGAWSSTFAEKPMEAVPKAHVPSLSVRLQLSWTVAAMQDLPWSQRAQGILLIFILHS